MRVLCQTNVNLDLCFFFIHATLTESTIWKVLSRNNGASGSFFAFRGGALEEARVRSDMMNLRLSYRGIWDDAEVTFTSKVARGPEIRFKGPFLTYPPLSRPPVLCLWAPLHLRDDGGSHHPVRSKGRKGGARDAKVARWLLLGT